MIVERKIRRKLTLESKKKDLLNEGSIQNSNKCVSQLNDLPLVNTSMPTSCNITNKLRQNSNPDSSEMLNSVPTQLSHSQNVLNDDTQNDFLPLTTTTTTANLINVKSMPNYTNFSETKRTGAKIALKLTTRTKKRMFYCLI